MLNYEFISLLQSGVSQRTSTILISYLATEEKIEQLFKINWYNANADSGENKYNMKAVGASAMSYSRFLKEMTIITISKNIEDLINDIDEFLKIRLNFWKLDLSTKYYSEMKMLRNVSNCIKHNNGILIDNSNKSIRYLIDVCGFTPEEPVINDELNYKKLILKSYLFQYDLISNTLTLENPFKNVTEEEFEKIINFLVPPILNLT